jgi:hypothetical protein
MRCPVKNGTLLASGLPYRYNSATFCLEGSPQKPGDLRAAGRNIAGRAARSLRVGNDRHGRVAVVSFLPMQFGVDAPARPR